MSGRLAGKVAIITGAASGQGAAAAESFIAEGAKVAAFDINESGLQNLKSCDELLLVTCDLTDSAAVRAGIQATVDKFGRLDIIYNNAGVLLRHPGPWDETQDGLVTNITEEMFDRVMAINLRSQFLMCKYGIPHLIEACGGSIINVSSLSGAVLGSDNHAYTVSKAAVIGLTRGLAYTYGPKGIRTNTLCPGVVETPLVKSRLEDPAYSAAYLASNPLGRYAQSNEMAQIGLFLASDESSYINGSTITADGGWTIRGK
jgi:NAD(P)-dependent dehydrogenase (short-subunit alcohol dehydrogenase family)